MSVLPCARLFSCMKDTSLPVACAVVKSLPGRSNFSDGNGCWESVSQDRYMNGLAADEVQQITCEVIPMREEEAMSSPFIHLELAVWDRLRGPASTQLQGSALIFLAVNDQRGHRTGRQIRSEVRLILRSDALK